MTFCIISGGQSGVDRAALDVALKLKVACGGWCPKGRLAEDGKIPGCYPLEETPARDYQQRTRWNVRDSDGTLILKTGLLKGGTALTTAIAQKLHRPLLIVDLDYPPKTETVKAWLEQHHIHRLNVAGPRESNCPGIYARSFEWMRRQQCLWK